MQHDYDGAPYLSSAIDYAVDPKTGRRNVGCRRLMLRGTQHHAVEPHAGVRPQAHVPRMRRARRASASQLRGRRASARFPGGLRARDRRRRVRHRGVAARRAAADDARRVERPAGAGRRRARDRGLFRQGRLHRDRGAVRRVPRLLRPGAYRSGVPRHRDHHAQGRAAPDRAARHGEDRAQRSRASMRDPDRGAHPAGAGRGRHRSGRGLCGAERERLAACAGVGAARAAGAGARGDRGAVRDPVPQARLCARRGGRRVLRRGGGVGDGQPLPRRPRPRHRAPGRWRSRWT